MRNVSVRPCASAVLTALPVSYQHVGASVYAAIYTSSSRLGCVTPVPPTLSLYCEAGTPCSRSCPSTSVTHSLACNFVVTTLPGRYRCSFFDWGPRVNPTRRPLEPALLYRRIFSLVPGRETPTSLARHCANVSSAWLHPPTLPSALSMPEAKRLAGLLLQLGVPSTVRVIW